MIGSVVFVYERLVVSPDRLFILALRLIAAPISFSVSTVSSMPTDTLTSPQAAPTLVRDRQRQKYPNFKVIVLDDDVNTIPHVQNCLLTYIPEMTVTSAYDLTMQVHHEGQAIVWVGPQEQAELYHLQLKQEGLTMAPLEPAD